MPVVNNKLIRCKSNCVVHFFSTALLGDQNAMSFFVRDVFNFARSNDEVTGILCDVQMQIVDYYQNLSGTLNSSLHKLTINPVELDTSI